jgi:hypothetical protein
MKVELECDDFSVALIQCDPKFKTEMFLLWLMIAMNRRSPDLERSYELSSENKEVVDFPLFVPLDFFIAILKYLFMKECPVAVDPVIVLDGKEKQGECRRGVLVNGLMGQESK